MVKQLFANNASVSIMEELTAGNITASVPISQLADNKFTIEPVYG